MIFNKYYDFYFSEDAIHLKGCLACRKIVYYHMYKHRYNEQNTICF